MEKNKPIPNEFCISDDCPEAKLLACKESLIYIQERMKGLEFVFFVFLFAIVTLFLVGLIALIPFLLWMAIRELNFGGLLFTVFLFIASLPLYWGIVFAQSFLVRTKISVDNGKYEYISGFVRFGFTFDPKKSFIKIYPYPVKQGDWALAAKLYVPSIHIRNWVIPFTIIPNYVAAGSKWQGVKEAKDIHEWICEQSTINNVVLDLKYCRRKRKKVL